MTKCDYGKKNFLFVWDERQKPWFYGGWERRHSFSIVVQIEEIDFTSYSLNGKTTAFSCDKHSEK